MLCEWNFEDARNKTRKCFLNELVTFAINLFAIFPEVSCGRGEYRKFSLQKGLCVDLEETSVARSPGKENRVKRWDQWRRTIVGNLRVVYGPIVVRRERGVLLQVSFVVVNAIRFVIRVESGDFTSKRTAESVMKVTLKLENSFLVLFVTHDSNRWSICTKCCPKALRTTFPLSLTDAFQFMHSVMCLLFALIMLLMSSFVIFCCANGKYFASLLIRKLLAKFIWKTSDASSLMDLTQNDDKFVFRRSQKPVSLMTTFSSRSSRMHRMFTDSFGDRSELLTVGEGELLITEKVMRHSFNQLSGDRGNPSSTHSRSYHDSKRTFDRTHTSRRRTHQC